MGDTQSLPNLVESGESIAEVYNLKTECPVCTAELRIVKTTKDVRDGAEQFAERCLSCGNVSTTRAWLGPNMPVSL